MVCWRVLLMVMVIVAACTAVARQAADIMASNRFTIVDSFYL
jgi:hypothetical protein